jgi:outer membrane protein TolC
MMTRTPARPRAHWRRGLLLLVLAGGPLGAQTAVPVVPPGPAAAADSGQPLSLDDAVRLAEMKSEAVRAARAGVERARGDAWRARSQLFPQLYASAQYQRTLKSQFEVLQGPPDDRPLCEAFTPTGTTTDERIQELEEALQLATDCRPSGGIDFSRVGFGAKNQYQLGLSFSQNLFAGGRIASQVKAAEAGRRAADIELVAQRAQAVLEVTQAYLDAALADRLATISESALVQTEAVLRQTTLARQVGNTSEFELLRARVTRDNQVPQVIQRRGARALAVLRLKQLLEIPRETDLRLTTPLQDTSPPPLAQFASRAGGSAPDTAAESRAAVRQAEEAVRAQQAALRVARAQRLPAIALTSQYGRVAYPNAGVPGWNDFSQNWTVGVGLQVPLFTGGRIRGDEMVARANLEEARARSAEAREYAALDAMNALSALQEAEAQWSASAGTGEQAARAYGIAELRYREGISTQTELSEARLLLQQAQANRALAARDLQLARVRLALLRDLPLAAPGAAGGADRQPSSTMPSQQGAPQPAPQTPQGQNAEFGQTAQTGGFAP